jgi:polysaccharide deacetylase family protein (PEP-CTERM system associated)
MVSMDKHIFTVDVEEFYHAENILRSVPGNIIDGLPDRAGIGVYKILKILEDTGNKGTFFVLGCVAERNKELVREISDCGHEVASHGYDHIPLYKHNAASFERDLDRSIKILSDIIGSGIKGYRAASFSLSKDMPWFFDTLIKHGIMYDSSLAASLFRKYSYEGTDRILEFPVSFITLGPLRLPLGGGYFRALPYIMTLGGLRSNSPDRVIPPLFYIHPWELDPEQPRLKTPWMRSFRHYLNLAGTKERLERLLTDIKFTSIERYLKESKENKRS